MSTTFYSSNAASTIGGLTQSNQMSQASGGVETSVSVTMPSSSTNTYVELLSQGGTSSGYASLPAPTGKGWSIALSGNTIPSGSWSSVFTLAKSGTSMTGASLVVRWFRRTIDGTYYPIGVATLASQTFSTTKTVYTLPSVTASLWQFISGDTLYMDAFPFNAGTSWGSAVFTVYVSNSASAGVANDGTITTPTTITTPPGLSCLISNANFQSGSGVPVLNQAFTLADALDQRSILTLTGEDTAGALSFQRGMPVMFSDSGQGLLYTGYVNSDKVTRPSAGGSAQLEHQLTMMDHHYDADKRANTTNYLNWTAGDITCDFIDKTLGQEGITGQYAIESDYSQTAFAQGTLSGTTATTTTSPFTYAPNTSQPPITTNTGDLELTRAGTQFTLTEQTTSDFNSGTLTNMQAISNTLTPTTQNAICVQAQLPEASISLAVPATIIQIWSGSFVVGGSDTLNYDIWVSSASTTYAVGVDFVFSDGSHLSDLDINNWAPDQNFTPSGPSVPEFTANWPWGFQDYPATPINLAPFAKDAWYTRTIDLTHVAGKTINSVTISFSEQTAEGVDVVYIKNCYLGSQAGSPFFGTTATVTNVNPPVITTNAGGIVTTSIIAVWDPAKSYRVSPSHSISSVGLVASSAITWAASLPAATPTGQAFPSTLLGQTTTLAPQIPEAHVLVSYDNITWLPATNQAALPGLAPGANVAGLSIYLKEYFAASPYPTTLPSLLNVTINITSAANQTTSDVVASYGNTSQWNTGTFAKTTTNANGSLVLSMIQRDWADGLATNTARYFSINAAEITTPGKDTFKLTSGGSVGKVQLLMLGSSITDFTLDVDIAFTSGPSDNAQMQAGVEYRTTHWDSQNNTEAYEVFIAVQGPNAGALQPGWLEFGKGTNSGSGSYTQIAKTSNYNQIQPGTNHHLRIVVTGNTHTFYLDGAMTPTLTATDSSYPSAGGIGLRTWTNSGTGSIGNSAAFANVVLNQTWGTWTSPSISLSALGTCGNTQIAWNQLYGYSTVTEQIAPAANIVISTSLDNGATWQQCQVNGGTIPQLPVGTNVSGKSLKIQATLFAMGPPLLTPLLNSLYVRVCGNYGTVTGTRVSPALSLTNVSYVASSNCMWNANVPTNTSVTVATSQDNVTYTNVGNNGAGASLGYWTNQPSATQDLFSSNTSANYTNTFKSGGSAATATYDTANSRITLSGGSGGLYLNNSISTADVDLLCDMDESDAGGLAWREVSTSNYYELGVYDASSSGGFTNQLRLYKVSSGTRSLLGSASSITFTRGTFHRIRATMQGGLINIYWDGTCVQSYLDVSPLAAGSVGLRNDGGTSRYYQLWVQPLGTNLSGQVLYTKVTMTTTDPAQMPQLFTLVACVRNASIATGATISQLHPITTPFASYYSTEMDTLVRPSGDFYWYVNKWKQLIFGPRLARLGAFPVQSVVDSANSSGYLLYQPMVSVLSAADLFRNQQIVTDVTSLVTPPTETKVADGSATSWTMGYPLYSAPTITINGQVGATVGVQGIDNGRQFYWQPGSSSISYDSSLPKLVAGTILSFAYVGQSTQNVPLNNSSSQTAQAAIENNSGIVAEIESALNSSTRGMTTAQATTFGNGLLSRYGNTSTIELMGTTLYQGLAPGTVIPLFLPEIMSTWNAQLPIVKLTTTGYQGQNGLIYTYGIDATTGPNLSQWSRVWF